jgi:hypothetical protein
MDFSIRIMSDVISTTAWFDQLRKFQVGGADAPMIRVTPHLDPGPGADNHGGDRPRWR